MATTATPPSCTVRGHAHELTVHDVRVQDGTGARAIIWACPSGRYRWFQLEAHALASEPVSPLTRQTVPRFGWPS